MKLYIKQKVFSWKDKFYVKDEFGNDRYYIEGELFSFGKKLHIYDMNNNELAFIHQKVLSFLPRFFVYIGGAQVAEIVKEFTLFRNKYRIDGLGWEVDGDFMDHDYEITHMGRPIVSISKEWFTWGDSYMLDIADSVDPINALSVVLAIDCVIEMQRRASASN
ncbi:MAG: hypothetical protein E7538_07280 [Ruminococcaceae bacterium]|nr:hypothetical protein [Oscillospiraceae bacterium]